MDIPEPEPAQVIRYACLWAEEHGAGREEGRKDRPVAVVLTVQTAGGVANIAVPPITHTQPSGSGDAIEIPTTIKRSLGSDAEPSWIDAVPIPPPWFRIRLNTTTREQKKHDN